MATVLISGGTGLIGKQLTKLLIKKGYTVNILSRNKTSNPNIFYWNIEQNFIEEEAIKTCDYIIHLAGANITEKRWIKSRKQLLIDSRVKTANLLFEAVKKWNPL